ncbi:MAG: hypothetical protein M3373_01990 [Gemmatimonadota bacterium]|nr:hypothetical protein [Gemmatimonadota bacterium]
MRSKRRVLDHGFARVRCDSCAPEYVLAFSWKRRWRTEPTAARAFAPAAERDHGAQFRILLRRV